MVISIILYLIGCFIVSKMISPIGEIELVLVAGSWVSVLALILVKMFSLNE